MPLPVKERSWLISSNNLITGSTYLSDEVPKCLFLIKEQLKSWGWTVAGSNDTVDYGMDGVDRWITADNVVHQSGRIPWIVLTSPTVGWQITLAGYYYAAQAMGGHVLFSPQGGVTGGNVSSYPRADIELLFTNQTSIFGGSGNAAKGYIINMWFDPASDALRVLTLHSNQVKSFWMFEPVENGSGLIDLVGCSGSTTSTSTSVTVQIPTVNYLKNNRNTWSKDGTTSVGYYLTQEVYGSNSNISDLLTAANQLNNEWPMLPIGVVSADSGYRGKHGDLVDLYWGTENGSTSFMGGTYPNDGSRQWVQFSHMIFPWDGSVPVTSQ